MNHGIPLYSSEQTVLSYVFVLFSYNLYYYSHHFYMNYTIFIHHINLKKIRKKSTGNVADPFFGWKYISGAVILPNTQVILCLCLFFLKLTVIQIRIEALPCQQLFMISLLNDISVLHDQNQISIPDC